MQNILTIIEQINNMPSHITYTTKILQKVESQHDDSSVYNVVNTMRQDKDENIEFDTVITLEMITEVMHQIEKVIIEKANTNVFLFSQKASDRHAKIMKNLVNTRYLHVIKEATSSENRKREMFTAYLIDMSFYINGKQIKRGFEPKPFWEKDERYRLKYIESAPIFKLE